MKVVLLAGGLGTRMREETEFRPKPMVEIGGKPILWHIMKVFASYGHTDFVVCAGYKGEIIKDYFYNYPSKNLDFTVKLGNKESVVFHGSHEEFDWTVTVADTGQETPTGGRILRVKDFLQDETFLCTYGDGLAPVDINLLIATHNQSGDTATMTVTKPNSRFGIVHVDNGVVTSFSEKPQIESLVNIGFFVFEPKIFDLLNDEVFLEEEPLKALAASQKLGAFEHQGFWQPIDTYREYQAFNQLWKSGAAPWKIWE